LTPQTLSFSSDLLGMIEDNYKILRISIKPKTTSDGYFWTAESKIKNLDTGKVTVGTGIKEIHKFDPHDPLIALVKAITNALISQMGEQHA